MINLRFDYKINNVRDKVWITQNTLTTANHLSFLLYVSICLWNSLKANVIAFVNGFIEVYNYIFGENKNYIKVIQWSENDIILY